MRISNTCTYSESYFNLCRYLKFIWKSSVATLLLSYSMNNVYIWECKIQNEEKKQQEKNLKDSRLEIQMYKPQTTTTTTTTNKQ